ncbi:sensor histidine kinase [Deminuibacter soli]|uniref:Oxygen sensor histidine kinase NreB n=1 Tax=Deminuibacter soli TaxID=2291815 RepID=A0A3E1NI58_9BACT|nr:ATP-binding protein [Deminuibacter soli]RFM27626.1 two-component sensor histidine kinase [Deminuibacter soli]
MDDAKEGFLLIGTTMIVLVAFLITILAVMIIYRRRKLEHAKEIEHINERFSHELLQTQFEVQQLTMQHIGQEIHDNVGQKITLATIYLQQLQQAPPGIQQTIYNTIAILHESLSDLRMLSKDLTDASFLDTDLFRLISNECAKIEASGACAISLKSNVDYIDASNAIKSFTLRILQEFLQNSLKHAACSNISIALHHDSNGLQVKAEDNGRGFTLTPAKGNGIGLENMRKRAEMIQAAFSLSSIPGEGTRMLLQIPAHTLNR